MTGPNDIPGIGAAYDAKHIAEHIYHQNRRRGENTDGALMFMGGTMVVIGAKMCWDSFCRMTGRQRSGHGRSR